MNAEHYRIFYEVARCGSITAAARRLFVTQSAVSQQVAQLEKELRVSLFDRRPRGVTLTQEGELLFAYVERAMENLETGEKQLRRLLSLEDGWLSIAASDTVSEKLLLKPLSRFHAQFPRVKLRVVNKTSGDALSLLRAGDVELAFVNQPVEEEGVALRSCLTVHDVFVAAPHVAAAYPETVSAEDIARGRLVMLEGLSNARRLVDAAFLRRGVTLRPETELGAHRLLLDFARVGLGVACVIREFSLDELREGALRELNLQPPLPPRSIAVGVLKGARLSAAASAFLRGLPTAD